jgi:hypothetical protein
MQVQGDAPTISRARVGAVVSTAVADGAKTGCGQVQVQQQLESASRGDRGSIATFASWPAPRFFYIRGAPRAKTGAIGVLALPNDRGQQLPQLLAKAIPETPEQTIHGR